MTNFEKVTASPDVLGEFLASLPVATGPWDEEFHRAFCDSCELLECRAETCPYKVSAPVRFCNFSPNGECKKMAGKGEQPLNDYTCRFRPSSLKYTDKSGLDGLQADKWYGNQGCIHPHAARRKMTFHFG